MQPVRRETVLPQVQCDQKTRDILGENGIANVTGNLWAKDCQTCGEPLESEPPALCVDDAGTYATASLHHPRCRSAAWARDMTKAPETIRAASLVGGFAALDLIESVISRYPEHNSSKPVTEVTRAWQYFDHEDYARRVVAPLERRGLSIGHLRMRSAQ